VVVFFDAFLATFLSLWVSRLLQHLCASGGGRNTKISREMQGASEQIRCLVADAKARIAVARASEGVKEELRRIAEVIFTNGNRDGLASSVAEAAPRSPSREGRQAFFAEQYANWAHFLLQSVLPNWVLCFERDERARLFDAFFTSPDVPQQEAFLALAQALIDFGSGRAGPERDVAHSNSWNQGLPPKNPIVMEVRHHRPPPVSTTPDESSSSTEEKDFIGKTVAELLGTMLTTDGGLSRLFDHFARLGGYVAHRLQHSLTQMRRRRAWAPSCLTPANRVVDSREWLC
jgi:hypothetical protein